LASTLAKPLHFRKQPLEILILVHVILAVGLNILVGYTGQLSIGYAVFLPLAPRRPPIPQGRQRFLPPARLCRSAPADNQKAAPMSHAGQNKHGIDGGRPVMLPEMDRQSVRSQRLSSLVILPRVHSFF